MDELSEICARARRYARAHPVTDATINVALYRHGVMRPYCFQYGENLKVMLTYCMTRMSECPFPPPFWHVQLIMMEIIGELEYGAVEEAMVSVQSWSPEQMSMATAVLGEALAPVIKRPSQAVHVHDGLFARHIFLAATEEDEKATAN